MSEELEQSQSDVSNEASSAPQPSSEPENTVKTGTSQESDKTPFHEHPRFKELIQQKNEFSERLKQYESRFEQMSKELTGLKQPKAEEPKFDKTKLLERLKGIDPEFAAYQASLLKELDDLRGWKDTTVQERTSAEVQSTLSKLHQDHKVDSPELQEWYKTRLKALSDSNPNLGVKDLPGMYKSVHESITKYFDSRDRQTVANYANQKKADSKVPSNSKGQSAKPHTPKPVQYSKDPEEARAQRVAGIMKEIRAGRENL